MLAAVQKGNAKKLAELIRQDPGFEVNIARDSFGNGSTLLHIACWDSHCSHLIPLLLAHPDFNVNSKDNFGATPFFYACRYGQTPCVREMLKDSRVKVNEPRNDGYTPLFWAASDGHLDIIKWWIASGREMDLGIPGDVDKTDAIGRARNFDTTEVVTLLERFQEYQEDTRQQVRMGLEINGQTIFNLLFFFFFFFFFLDSEFLFFFLFRFPCVHPTKAHQGAVRRLRWWKTPCVDCAPPLLLQLWYRGVISLTA